MPSRPGSPPSPPPATPTPPSPPSPADNTALPFTGKFTVTVREKDLPDASLRFTNGDSITLEAWVKVQELKNGSYAYLLGKGRTRRAGFPYYYLQADARGPLFGRREGQL